MSETCSHVGFLSFRKVECEIICSTFRHLSDFTAVKAAQKTADVAQYARGLLLGVAVARVFESNGEVFEEASHLNTRPWRHSVVFQVPGITKSKNG